MTLKERIFNYLRENPKADNKEIAEQLGTTDSCIRATLHRAKISGEIAKNDEGIEILKEVIAPKLTFKKEVIYEMIDIFMEDFRNASPLERVDIGKRITMLLERL